MITNYASHLWAGQGRLLLVTHSERQVQAHIRWPSRQQTASQPTPPYETATTKRPAGTSYVFTALSDKYAIYFCSITKN